MSFTPSTLHFPPSHTPGFPCNAQCILPTQKLYEAYSESWGIQELGTYHRKSWPMPCFSLALYRSDHSSCALHQMFASVQKHARHTA